ncbi:ATP-grasp domain-containing protein [Moraxella sp. PS-22]|uniref:ATP-grasp domain-containing protein n=1 Tax=Moraxella tetraodonis TaxID=2767221 RepID=A0A9X2A5K3_9GAMM|nr:ATP-grasp domain-containing protein [Moraxella tetraodonis]MCG8148608.1 ATP-grasp domain-containing protein [Moraxella tetraodonis]
MSKNKSIILAGAAALKNIDILVNDFNNHGLEVIVIENDEMFQNIEVPNQSFVIKTQVIPVKRDCFIIPLNEYWVTQAIKNKVANISDRALTASRSKMMLSHYLKKANLNYVDRFYLASEHKIDDLPTDFIARLDSAYSSYGIFRNFNANLTSVKEVIELVLKDNRSTMNLILGVEVPKIVIEEYIEGQEYSTDILFRNGKVEILRVTQKIITWHEHKPVCEAYVTPKYISAHIYDAIKQWCLVLFNESDYSFAHFDFIENSEGLYPLDFSCRLGGGLNSLKDFSGIQCYVAQALLGKPIVFTPLSVQKNLITEKEGEITQLFSRFNPKHHVIWYKKLGDKLVSRIGSANARIGEVCFKATSISQAKRYCEDIDSQWSIIINGV